MCEHSNIVFVTESEYEEKDRRSDFFNKRYVMCEDCKIMLPISRITKEFIHNPILND